MTWPVAFALTLLVEVPVYVLGLRRRLGAGRAAGVGVLVNLATHPALWFGLRAADLTGGGYVVGVLTAEVAVILVEAVLVQLLGRPGPGGAVRLSAAANTASFLVGLLLALV